LDVWPDQDALSVFDSSLPEAYLAAENLNEDECDACLQILHYIFQGLTQVGWSGDGKSFPWSYAQSSSWNPCSGLIPPIVPFSDRALISQLINNHGVYQVRELGSVQRAGEKRSLSRPSSLCHRPVTSGTGNYTMFPTSSLEAFAFYP